MIYFMMTLLIIAADQLSKKWAVSALMGQPPQTLISGVIGVRYVENTGAAFSIFSGKQLLLIVITFIILGLILGLFIRAIKNDEIRIVKFAYAFIIAGAVGNFIDRVRLNYVVDFFEFKFIKFPIFNVADIFVVAGVALLAIATIVYKYEL